MRKTIPLCVLSVLSLSACVVGDNYYYEVPAEAPLTTAEVAELATGEEIEHNHDLEVALATEVPEDDAATFDTADVSLIVDVEVTDTEGPSVTNTVIYAALLRYGLHPRASDAFRAAGVAAWRMTQTIGNAAASAGTHAQDGTVNGAPYSAATDISTSGMSLTQIHNLLESLGKLGFAAWYRRSGYDGWYGANHIHAVYANCRMKASLRSQVRSWLVGRNGLVSNTIYQFHAFTAQAKAGVKGKFAMSGEGTTNGGAGISGRVSTDGTPLNVRAGTTTTAAIISTIPSGTYVTMSCQKVGQSMTGTYGTTTLWDRVNGGYVTDAYVATGSDGQVAPTCN